MATTKQKQAAGKNTEKARKARSERASGERVKKSGSGLGTAGKNRLSKKAFAFPDERKEPLSDARHVRNAIARFDQVEGVTDAERDKAWKRIVTAAEKYDVDVSVNDWRELVKGGRAKKK
jgi:RecJ-like exonuclease